MKKFFTSILICLTMCLAIGLTGCGNEFAKREYDNAEKIVQIEDCYAKENSIFNSTEDGCILTVSKFDGRQTLWKKTLEKDVEMEIQLDLTISSGNAKVVYIDCNDNITVLIECSQNNYNEQTVTKSISLTSGLNRLKIVGYDCKYVDLKILFQEP